MATFHTMYGPVKKGAPKAGQEAERLAVQRFRVRHLFGRPQRHGHTHRKAPGLCPPVCTGLLRGPRLEHRASGGSRPRLHQDSSPSLFRHLDGPVRGLYRPPPDALWKETWSGANLGWKRSRLLGTWPSAFSRSPASRRYRRSSRTRSFRSSSPNGRLSRVISARRGDRSEDWHADREGGGWPIPAWCGYIPRVPTPIVYK